MAIHPGTRPVPLSGSPRRGRVAAGRSPEAGPGRSRRSGALLAVLMAAASLVAVHALSADPLPQAVEARDPSPSAEAGFAGAVQGLSPGGRSDVSAQPSEDRGPATAHTSALSGEEAVWVVGPGETLWSIARRVAPQEDPRRVVEAIRRLNGLHTAVLRIGQSLRLPPGLEAR
ncbi:LysM peptidoglycan-binding domain-containing protein [Limnochorda pilosa]|uniref:LysM domain-containing protein n=1 Tax=Limnochorda pilosa TaxID=1555112 RepID=A0A0K2SKH7_LIMPI|nr:LysM peptidoglycan-binding domain-containing protein [Limnochorda pilosa]BAS27600.1 hypothetical protein LIP_1754 [Limnochorda pilosa]